MGTISGCWDLKMNLKAKMYLYVNSTSQRCPNNIIETFMIEDFFHLPPVGHLWCTLSGFSKKFETALMVYSVALRKLIHEKNQKSKILWHWPFKPIDKGYEYFRKTGLSHCAGKPLRPEINRKVWREGTGSYRISWRVRTYRPVLSHALFIRKVQVW